MADEAERLVSGAAWREWCERLKALGETLQGDAFPSDPRARAEGFRTLTRYLVFAVQMEMEAGDPRFPVFQRYEEPWTQWGGPNPDNLYLRAALDSRLTYRVWGDVRGVRQAVFSLHEGDMQLEEYGVYGERRLDQLGVGGDGRLEILLSPEEQPGNWIPMHPKARILTVRVYLGDWERDVAPKLHIVCAGQEGVPPPPPEPADVARALDRAATWVERSLVYWNEYLRRALAQGKPNEVSPARSTPGGAQNLLYGSCFWDLRDGEALLVTSEVPDADYWNYTIHNLAWFDSGDFASRQTSLNGDQMRVDRDGRFRIVVSHRDPGVPNWIDTEGRRRGLLAFRYLWARNSPKPESQVVPLEALAQQLPADHPRVDAGARRASLARRRAALWSRYR